jgi:hypothetical protein
MYGKWTRTRNGRCREIGKPVCTELYVGKLRQFHSLLRVDFQAFQLTKICTYGQDTAKGICFKVHTCEVFGF